MPTAIENLPRTLMEVYKLLPEGTRAELIDNILYMPPSPTSNHQSHNLRLASRLLSYLEKMTLVQSSPILLMYILMRKAMPFNRTLLWF